ncbi:helix-turn-helix domain-containing protein [Paenibacillus amylolyticus]|uniref:helix-turn-helix domain-containing protein n=1 Tax=Paenibacillus amylolyticus TaxID=1451 RepID=UPI0034508C88
MSYSHLSIIERSKLEILHSQGQSSRAISIKLRRHKSKICRKLDCAAALKAEQAQNAYEELCKASISQGR